MNGSIAGKNTRERPWRPGLHRGGAPVDTLAAHAVRQ